ncbi:uncharacterized protein LOC108465357 [Gossypium arboreum]|uniref:uncharacterized protein LOC108465357 n=1 Tax=Gossypium arboreum TaxID=29729 RepID=UPI0008197424|nr:uncharacterized protein LOC108465357 [Gossypium arboreum]
MEGLNGGAVKSNLLNPNEYRVKDLWLDESRSWNIRRVRELYGQDLSDKICNLPIGDENHNDIMVWFHNSLGSFTSKSVYSWLLLKQMGFGPHRFLWKALWKLDTIPKILVFTWRVGHEILPTNVKIASVRRGFGQECPRCGAEYKTLIHALKDCPTSRAILSIGGLDKSIISKDYKCCIDCLEVLDRRAMADLLTALWNCWNNRNNFFFRAKEEEAQVVRGKDSMISKDFRICNLLNESLLSSQLVAKKREKPPKGHVKINFDASISYNRVGYGVIIRDEDGFVLRGGGGFKDMQLLVDEAEWYAFDESIKLACKLNIKGDVIFESHA